MPGSRPCWSARNYPTSRCARAARGVTWPLRGLHSSGGSPRPAGTGRVATGRADHGSASRSAGRGSRNGRARRSPCLNRSMAPNWRRRGKAGRSRWTKPASRPVATDPARCTRATSGRCMAIATRFRRFAPAEGHRRHAGRVVGDRRGAADRRLRGLRGVCGQDRHRACALLGPCAPRVLRGAGRRSGGGSAASRAGASTIHIGLIGGSVRDLGQYTGAVKTLLRIALLAAVLSCLPACGNKGPLVLPPPKGAG